MSTVLGIDLGTTNSVVATVDRGGAVRVLPNATGQSTTPSAVYLESSGEGVVAVVGEEARHLCAVDPGNGVVLIKRHMGTDFPLSIRGQDHTPESVSALILRQLVAATGLPGPVRAVVTVPAYFGSAEREATATACRIAGLEVLELLDEPVAAAVHYGLTTPGDRTVLVYDLGGGTFDTTVLRIRGEQVTVVATDGHSALGGADVDRRLLELVLGRLETLLPAADLEAFADDDALLGAVLLDLEAAKRDLSTATVRDLVIHTAADRLTVRLHRQELEEICADLFDTTHEIIERVLAKARAKGVSGVDEVVMVGGSSRIPLLATRLGELLGVTPQLVDPDLAVAKGAALRAHRLAGPGPGPAAGLVVPVTPRAVGILIDDSFTPGGERRFVAHLVRSDEELPVTRRTVSFGTVVDGQSSVRVQVYEQAGPVASPEIGHNNRVLDGELTGLGNLPAGSVIEIRIEIAVDGRLTVVAREPRSRRELTLEAYMDGVVDSAEADRLTRAVGLIAVRG